MGSSRLVTVETHRMKNHPIVIDEEFCALIPPMSADSKAQVLPDLYLEFCERTDPRYKDIRDRHYVPNRGAQGRQLHFLIHYKGEIVGIVSAGSPIWSRKERDKFFGITRENRAAALNCVVNMTVFRLEKREPNLASRVISMWEKVVPYLWREIYGTEVCGFETLIEPTNGRNGSSYKAAGWTNASEVLR